MKKTAAAASALALGALTTPAHAQEPGGTHDWTGFYAGAGVGVTTLDADWDIDGGEGFFNDEDGSESASADAGAIAIQGGYNHQFGPLVVGGEVDYTLSDLDETTRFDGGEGAELRTRIKHLGTVRARVGYAMDRLLVFGTGGLAIGDLRGTYDSDGSPSTKHVDTGVGWVAGGGVEFAASENISLFIEGLFASFEDAGTASGPFYDDEFDVGTDLTLARLGVNVRF